jgi:SNF2 family DNA or RNA helicase
MANGQFAPFLMQIIPALQLLDINILLPKAMQSILKPKASVKIKKKAGGKSFLRLNELLDFEWQVAIGDRLLGEEEFRKLMQNSEGLIKFKANYIYVGKDELEKLHKHFTSTKEMSSFQMLRTALSGEYNGAAISLSDEVKDLIKQLNTFDEITLPAELKANLRPYQHRGFSWMFRNAQIGIGSVIADDMGLGKTLQVLATILKFKEQGLLEEQKILVVAPTGLLTNWMAEIEKFTPSLKAVIYHGTNRSLNALGEYDVMISSYGIMRSDAEKIKKLKWHSLIIDEAQNIKNQDTAQTKAIKSIKSNNFVAMSGTPVENRLSELWSIMDYCNRGLLGNLKEFADTYSYPIEQLNDASVAEKLKKVTGPFMMRRMKTDKSIISDLPDKIEMNCFASLTKDQASLYSKTLEECMNAIEGVEAKDHQGLFVRQGLVLQMILALKQICNHPTQFLKNNKLDASMSGKMELLFDKLDSIMDSSEKVLIFTQFTEMGNLLKHFIAERYKEEPLYYHGGSSLAQRKQMVERFQTNHADKIFILSLKAAGTGLNLTAASHVIHYDLWWNPAVENQATDRAFRIGQKNNVMVHRFITKNTFEERIDEMIQNKKHLADISVATGENWIGKLSNKELREIFG